MSRATAASFPSSRTSSATGWQKALVVLVHLADDARAHVVAPVEQLLLDLVLDDLAALLDDHDLFEADREFADALRLQRPGHADLVQPKGN